MSDFINRVFGGQHSDDGQPGSSHHWEPAPGFEAHESESPWDQDKLERLVATRRSLHGVAELLLAGPQHRVSETIRLAVTPTGFRTVAAPDIQLDVDELVVDHKRTALFGTFVHVADSVGLVAAAPFDVYTESPNSDPRRTIHIDHEARHAIVTALSRGDLALRAVAPDQTPVLWPEHFDVSVTVDDVTYGVSPGDDDIQVPYAYVAPAVPRVGEFWNKPFGAARSLAELRDQDALLAFFRQGAEQAAATPPRG